MESSEISKAVEAALFALSLIVLALAQPIAAQVEGGNANVAGLEATAQEVVR